MKIESIVVTMMMTMMSVILDTASATTMTIKTLVFVTKNYCTSTRFE
jgi:hypothetical protein